MVFPWFLLALWLNMEALTGKLLSGSGKVTQAAAGHQAGERCTATRADSHVNQCSEIEPKSCENRSSPTVLGTCLSEYNSSLNLNKACLMAIWVSEELIHSGAHAHPGQEQELQPKGDTGSLGWVLHPRQTCPSWPCTPRTTLRRLVGFHRYVSVAHKVISSKYCSPSTDSGIPRAEDYFWPAGLGCCCLSQLSWGTALCCQPQEQMLVPGRTSGNPCC